MPANGIEIRGVKYRSQIEACIELGISTGTLSTAKKQGRLDYVGLRKFGAIARRQTEQAERKIKEDAAENGLAKMIRMAARESAAVRAHWSAGLHE